MIGAVIVTQGAEGPVFEAVRVGEFVEEAKGAKTTFFEFGSESFFDGFVSWGEVELGELEFGSRRARDERRGHELRALGRTSRAFMRLGFLAE